MLNNHPHNSRKYARIEEERRFLLNRFPAAVDPDGACVRIIDQYILGTRLGLRRIESQDGKAMVYKLGQNFQAPNQEVHKTIMTNIYLNEVEYKALAHLAHSTLTKRRYPFHHNDFDYSLDQFEGHFEGLRLAEIESQGWMDITRLPCPEFAVREVTADPLFTGGSMAEISQAEFQHWLASQ